MDLSLDRIWNDDIIINGKIFEKKKWLKIKRVFQFYLQLLPEKFPTLRGTERDTIKNCVLVFM